MKTIACQGIIGSISSKVDRSLGLRISTPELSNEEKALFFELQGLNLDITFIPKDEENVPEYKIDKEVNQKTPSQRLYGSLFRVWDSQGRQGEFDEYYKNTMEKIIDRVKEKII